MTIHAAPIPSIAVLIRALFTPYDRAGLRWRGQDRHRTVRCFSAGRSALMTGIRDLLEHKGRPQGHIWLPEYFCREAVGPLEALGGTLFFYPVRRDLSPDWDGLRAAARGGHPPDVFVLVHYFGFWNRISEAQAFCAEFNADLVEDCAHVLLPPAGRDAATAVFSPWKLLPVPEGGLLITARTDNAPPTQFRSHTPSIVRWMAVRLAQRMFITLGVPWHRLRKDGLGVPGPGQQADAASVEPALPDKYAFRLLAVVAGDLESAVRARREHYRMLLQATDGIDSVEPVFPRLPDDVCPYVFALIVREGRDEVHGCLRARGVPSSDWPDLPDAVIRAPERHHWATWLQTHILVLPIHQDLSRRQVAHMKAALREALVEKGRPVAC